MHLVPNIVFAACFAATLAISLPAPAQGTSGPAGAYPQDAWLLPGKNAIPDPLSAQQRWEYYACSRRRHNIQKRKRRHCIGYNAGACIAVTGLVPVEILGYALQDYSGPTSTAVVGIFGGGLGLLGLGAGIMYLGTRHEAHHPQKFLSR